MTPKCRKVASLVQEICTLWFQFFGAAFASKGYPFKNICKNIFSSYSDSSPHNMLCVCVCVCVCVCTSKLS